MGKATDIFQAPLDQLVISLQEQGLPEDEIRRQLDAATGAALARLAPVSGQPQKMKLHSPDLVLDNIRKLAAIFPNCVTETYDDNGAVRQGVNYCLLRQELSDHIVDGPQERYHLNWPGKREALIAANAPIAKTLRPARDESVNFDTTQNLFIEGDNLDALKLLQETYLGKVKMIYIDPPYNTGRNLIYKNDYSETQESFLEKSSQVSETGNRMVANPETNGRFHSDWLSMIYSRLRIAKSLLASDGVLVCAIDENEFATLSLVLKEIFGEGSYNHDYISLVHNPRGIQGTNFSYTNEYAIFISPLGSKQIGNKRLDDNQINWTQLRNWGGESERSDAKNCFYPIIVQNDKITGFGDVCDDDEHPQQTEIVGDVSYVYPIDRNETERKWRYARQSVEAIKHLLRARKTSSGFEIEIGKTETLHKSIWNDSRYDSNEYGTKILNSLIEGAGFTFPKSLWTIYDAVEAVCSDNKTAIIVDFFAGSSTTAHAVLQLNADDGGNRKFVMCQIPEACKENIGFKNIAEISKERIRRAGAKILEGECHPDWNKDTGFRVLKVDTSNMKDVYYRPDEVDQSDLLSSVDNIKPDRTGEDLLFQVLVDWGVDLTLPIRSETIAGKPVWFVDDSSLIACFETGLDEEFFKQLAGHKPLRVVFCDNGFASDEVKVNMTQIFQQFSPETDCRVI